MNTTNRKLCQKKIWIRKEKQINDVGQNVAYFSAGDIVLKFRGRRRLLWCKRRSIFQPSDDTDKVSAFHIDFPSIISPQNANRNRRQFSLGAFIDKIVARRKRERETMRRALMPSYTSFRCGSSRSEFKANTCWGSWKKKLLSESFLDIWSRTQLDSVT